MMARGGWINTTYGNLELLSDKDAHWFARVQSLFLHFQSEGRIKTFGEFRATYSLMALARSMGRAVSTPS